MQLIENLIDWAIEDVDLLSIRARGSHMRRLDVDDGDESQWQIINYILVVVGLGLVIAVSFVRRRNLTPVIVPAGSAKQRDAGAEAPSSRTDDEPGDDEPDRLDADDDEDAKGEEE